MIHHQRLYPVAVLICLTLFSQTASSSPLRGFPTNLDQGDREEMVSLAARIIRIAMAIPDSPELYDKRNAGTVDTVWHLPDLLSHGKR